MKTTGTIEGGDGWWNEPNTGATNESGFSALPGGYYSYYSGLFFHMDHNAYFWSSTEYDDGLVPMCCAWTRSLSYSYSSVYRSYGRDKHFGLSVRCIKD